MSEKVTLTPEEASYISSKINLEARNQVIASVVDFTGLDRIYKSLIGNPAIMDVPRNLYGVIKVRVQVGDEVETVEADEFILEEYKDAYFPDFLSVNLPDLTNEQLISYSAFCSNAALFLKKEIEKKSHIIETLRVWIVRLKARFESLYSGNQAERRRLTKVDPTVMQLEDLLTQATFEKTNLEGEMKALDGRVRLVKQDQDRRSSEIRHGVMTSWGNAPTAGFMRR